VIRAAVVGSFQPGAGGLEVGYRSLGEVDMEHGSLSGNGYREIGIVGDTLYLLTDSISMLVDLADRVLVQQIQHYDATGHGSRVSVERTRVTHVALFGVVHVHYVLATTERTDREPTADDFSERGKIGDYTPFFLCSPHRNTGGHDFVEYEETVVLLGKIPGRLEILGRRGDHSGRTEERFDDETGKLRAVCFEDLLESVRVVVSDGRHAFFDGGRDSGVFPSVASNTDFDGVVCSVVSALHFQYVIPLGVCDSRSGRVHRRFCTGIGEPNGVYRRETIDESRGEFRYISGR
jgi:hypothetical protein